MSTALWQPRWASLSNPSVPDEMATSPVAKPVEGEAGKHMHQPVRVSASAKEWVLSRVPPETKPIKTTELEWES